MKLTKQAREALELAAQGRPIYPFSDGPRILRGDGSWLAVSMTTIGRLEQAGLIVRSEAYWLVTEAGRAKIGEQTTGSAG